MQDAKMSCKNASRLGQSISSIRTMFFYGERLVVRIKRLGVSKPYIPFMLRNVGSMYMMGRLVLVSYFPDRKTRDFSACHDENLR